MLSEEAGVVWHTPPNFGDGTTMAVNINLDRPNIWWKSSQ